MQRWSSRSWTDGSDVWIEITARCEVGLHDYVDEPIRFLDSIWKDPTIMKFVPLGHMAKPIWDTKENRTSRDSVADYPNVTGFRRNECFDAERWLWEPTINWGNHKDRGGGRFGDGNARSAGDCRPHRCCRDRDGTPLSSCVLSLRGTSSSTFPLLSRIWDHRGR